MIGALVLSVALAGAPPPEAIPWDSVWYVYEINILTDTTDTSTGHWIYFITREKYEQAMFGQTKRDLTDVKADLAILKRLLEAETKEQAAGDE